MGAGGGDFERAFGGFLTLHLSEVGAGARFRGLAGLRRTDQLIALEVIEQADQVGRGNHVDRSRPGRLRTLCRRTYQPLPFARGMPELRAAVIEALG